jgi:hypothetical protein
MSDVRSATNHYSSRDRNNADASAEFPLCTFSESEGLWI